MNENISQHNIQARLDYAIANGFLTGAVVQSAAKIVERLEQPLRVALLGLPASGKSTVLNLLSGQNLIPDGLQFPTIQVEHGIDAKMTCVLPDGSQKVISGTDIASLANPKPVFVTIAIDLPALSKINLLEIAASNSVDDQSKAISWACNRADAVIWCSTDFGPDEQDLWNNVPDHLIDHSFLLLTKIDQLECQSEINTRIALLQKSVGQEFRGILPISAKNALAAKASSGKLDLSTFKTSRAPGLIAAIKLQIENGQRAASDHGQQILSKYCANVNFDAIDPSSTTAQTPAEPPITTPAKKPDALKKQTKKVGPKSQSLTKIDRGILELAVSMLTDRVQDLSVLFDGPDTVSIDSVVQHCEETAASLSEILSVGATPAFADMIASSSEIEDIIILMNLEKENTRGGDALALLFQIWRDIDVVIALDTSYARKLVTG